MHGVNGGGGGGKTQKETKTERETVRRERTGWQCVGGSLLSSFGAAFCWQQDRHLSSPYNSSRSVDLTDTSLNNTGLLVCHYPSLLTLLFQPSFLPFFLSPFLDFLTPSLPLMFIHFLHAVFPNFPISFLPFAVRKKQFALSAAPA